MRDEREHSCVSQGHAASLLTVFFTRYGEKEADNRVQEKKKLAVLDH